MTMTWQHGVDPEGNATLEFRIRHTDRGEITGALWLPADVQPQTTLVCFGHGASGDRYQPPISVMAGRFSKEAQLPVLAVEGPVHGLRGDGVTGTAKQQQFISVFVQEDSVINMMDDWNDAIDGVQELLGVSIGNVAYFGLSMGSMFGIPMLAARHDVVVATLGLVGADTDSFPHGTEILEAAEKLACPVLFIMQLDDELISREQYLRVFDSLGSADKRIHANPGKHGQIASDEVDFAYEFMLDHIKGHTSDRNITVIAQ
ncbi:MAG: alpha/beta hydrolase [Pseudomonadales bacterium]